MDSQTVRRVMNFTEVLFLVQEGRTMLTSITRTLSSRNAGHSRNLISAVALALPLFLWLWFSVSSRDVARGDEPMAKATVEMRFDIKHEATREDVYYLMDANGQLRDVSGHEVKDIKSLSRLLPDEPVLRL